MKEALTGLREPHTGLDLAGIETMPTPHELQQEYPLVRGVATTIAQTRREIIDIFAGRDRRTLAVVGPCSLDDTRLADGTPSVLRFAEELAEIRRIPEIEDNLLVIMRSPPSKPRTDLGWTGLEEERPEAARDLLSQIVNNYLPLGIEVMEREQLARYGDLLSLGWVGARNNKDTGLRRTLSAYAELPILCKNDDHGDINAARLALRTIAEPQKHVRVTLPDGQTGKLKESAGNPNGAILWRGGSNYSTSDLFETGVQEVIATGLPYGVDCSHGNTQAHDPNKKNSKTVLGQLACFDHLVELVNEGSLQRTPRAVMIEAHLIEGSDPSGKTAGMSRTDPCVNIGQLAGMLKRMASAAF